MDRIFLLGLILSAGMHTAVIARVRVPGERGDAFELPPGLELRYVETAKMAEPLRPQAAGGGEAGAFFKDAPTGLPVEPGAERAAAPVAYALPAKGRAGYAPLRLQGTGEVLRASVQETLRPLFVEGNPRDEEFSVAVRRYKTRLETILERESRIAYPDPAKEGGCEARLQIRFSVRQDGRLESVELPPSCGGFENELVAGLRKASRHFPAFPEEIRCSRLTFCWPVSFNLY